MFRWVLAISISFGLHAALGVYFVVNKPSEVIEKPASRSKIEMSLNAFKTSPMAEKQAVIEKSAPIKRLETSPKKIKPESIVTEKTLEKNSNKIIPVELPQYQDPVDKTLAVVNKSAPKKQPELIPPEQNKPKATPEPSVEQATQVKVEKSDSQKPNSITPNNEQVAMISPPVEKSVDRFTEEGLLLITDPVYLTRKKPVYPRKAIKRNQEGVVMVDATIDVQGYVIDIKIHQSSRYKLLDRSAVKAVKAWQFEPASRNGSPVTSVARIPVNFLLSDP